MYRFKRSEADPEVYIVYAFGSVPVGEVTRDGKQWRASGYGPRGLVVRYGRDRLEAVAAMAEAAMA